MGRPARWMRQMTGRSAMRSPGAPSLRREIERLFWKQIATGITSEKAAEAVGVSQPAGGRWFRYRGGMPLFMSNSISGKYLSFAEREEIGLLSTQGVGVREIARRIERSPSTVSRELTRNAATRGGKLEYRASVAQWKAELIAKRPKPSKLATNVSGWACHLARPADPCVSAPRSVSSGAAATRRCGCWAAWAAAQTRL